MWLLLRNSLVLGSFVAKQVAACMCTEQLQVPLMAVILHKASEQRLLGPCSLEMNVGVCDKMICLAARVVMW